MWSIIMNVLQEAEKKHYTAPSKQDASQKHLSAKAKLKSFHSNLVSKHPAATQSRQQILTERGGKQKQMKTVGRRSEGWKSHQPPDSN